MIVWQRHNGVTEQVEIPDPIEQDEPITFESKQELDNYIADFIVEFLTEGENGQ